MIIKLDEPTLITEFNFKDGDMVHTSMGTMIYHRANEEGEGMKTFKLKVDIEFEAENVRDAAARVANHFLNIATGYDTPDQEENLEWLHFIGQIQLEPKK